MASRQLLSSDCLMIPWIGNNGSGDDYMYYSWSASLPRFHDDSRQHDANTAMACQLGLRGPA
jgi:hypothetical protein